MAFGARAMAFVARAMAFVARTMAFVSSHSTGRARTGWGAPREWNFGISAHEAGTTN
jgi:hypothetical protein